MTAAARAMIAGAERLSNAAWAERVALINRMFAEHARYQADPEYRAAVDADRAARQAVVADRMSAGIAHYRANRGIA